MACDKYRLEIAIVMNIFLFLLAQKTCKVGFEPTTYRLTVECSAYWATCKYCNKT